MTSRPTKLTPKPKATASVTKAVKLVHVKTTIPPHVANVLMRELKVETPQEAVDKILALDADTEAATKKPRRK